MESFRREPVSSKLCYLCGDDSGRHRQERFCPFNYMYMCDTLGTCRRRCKHCPVSGSGRRRREFLGRVVRVNNVPSKLRPWHLRSLCKAFGPLRMYHLVMNGDRFCRGFGYAIFWSRRHAGKAIEGLNGRIIDGRKLRVDWAYPCTI
uniref:RRM domain-containing protein n=1 Tax=Oryza meridionalis TaxID=40149 RepID=A0A0E0ERK9_9ORYZ